MVLRFAQFTLLHYSSRQDSLSDDPILKDHKKNFIIYCTSNFSPLHYICARMPNRFPYFRCWWLGDILNLIHFDCDCLTTARTFLVVKSSPVESTCWRRLPMIIRFSHLSSRYTLFLYLAIIISKMGKGVWSSPTRACLHIFCVSVSFLLYSFLEFIGKLAQALGKLSWRHCFPHSPAAVWTLGPCTYLKWDIRKRMALNMSFYTHHVNTQVSQYLNRRAVSEATGLF